jgi:hypothetical protein
MDLQVSASFPEELATIRAKAARSRRRDQRLQHKRLRWQRKTQARRARAQEVAQ